MTGTCRDCGIRIHDPANCSTRYGYSYGNSYDRRLGALEVAQRRYKLRLCAPCYRRIKGGDKHA